MEDEYNRSIRVFVSSTFLDMQAERDELVTKVFPALRTKYRARGVEVFEVDLRWGITKEMQERGDTLPTLLAEIDRCRPYFIGLLGDRYGWVPPPEAITDRLRADYPAIADAQGMSVTAMEIVQGVLSNPDATAGAVIFERDPGWDWMSSLDASDRLTDAENSEAIDRLAELKSQVRARNRVERYSSPEEIGQKVFKAFDALLETRFPEQDTPDVLELTNRLHRAYARERRGLHVGADGYIRDLHGWMKTKAAPPRLITGVSGGGKSTLIANWLQAWRKSSPGDVIFEHYLGASSDSADPMLLMRRLWEHLNRATGEEVALPDADADLMGVSAGLTQRLSRVLETLERAGRGLVIALDGLDKLAGERNLRWLPLAPGAHFLASTLEGEAKVAALARGFTTLEVKPLTRDERQHFIECTLARWRRGLEPGYVERILNPKTATLAGSPLYLKTVLDELRVSADNARLAQRLEVYCDAGSMPDLFDRVLARLEEDCEPDLVARILPLIWASRAGLEEAEIMAIASASPLAWATLRNGLGDGLRDQSGRMAFGHDYLNTAVKNRYAASEEERRAAHIRVADRFDQRAFTQREAEELPYQLVAAGALGDVRAWNRLEALLVDLRRFTLLRARGDVELLGYWLPLQARGRVPSTLLSSAFETGDAGDSDIELMLGLSGFLRFSGARGSDLQRLSERALARSRDFFGPDDTRTHAALENLAWILLLRGHQAQGQEMQLEAVKSAERLFGGKDPRTLRSQNMMGQAVRQGGDYPGSEPWLRGAYEGSLATLGKDHPSTLQYAHSLALTLLGVGNMQEAEELHRATLERRKRMLGPEHLQTFESLDGLATVLVQRRKFSEAVNLYETLAEMRVRVLGREHPDTLMAQHNLAVCLRQVGRQAEGLKLHQATIPVLTRVLGKDHPQVIAASRSIQLAQRDVDAKTHALGCIGMIVVVALLVGAFFLLR